MRRNPSTVVVLVGEVREALLAAGARGRASRARSSYVLVPADPLSAVAAQWRARWDVSRESEGPAGFELQARLALAAWRALRA